MHVRGGQVKDVHVARGRRDGTGAVDTSRTEYNVCTLGVGR